MEIEYHLLDKMFDFLPIFPSNNHCPIMGETLRCGSFSPAGRMAQYQLDLNRLKREYHKDISCQQDMNLINTHHALDCIPELETKLNTTSKLYTKHK